MIKKSGIILLVACMVLLSACGGKSDSAADSGRQSPDASASQGEAVSPEQKETVTIRFMQYTASGSQEKTLEAMVKAFEAANPDIKVETEVVEFNNYYTKLNTLVATNSAPDVFEVGYENFMTYATKDLLLDLTPIIQADTGFDPGIYKKLAYDAFNYNGKQMGVVESFSNVVLFYNKDLFDQKGVKYPDASWTWKEELEAAQKLTDAKNGVWGTYAPVQFWEFYKTIAQNGGGIWDQNGNPTLNSKANVDALQWMLDKANKYHVSPPLNDDTFNQPDADLNAFKAGKLAMLRAGIWNFGRFADAPFQWDIALEPGNTQKAHHFFADALVASKNTKHPEAVWKFIKFMTSDPAAVKKRIEAGWSVPALNDENVMAAYYKQTPPESKKVVTDALDTLVLPPVGPKPEKWNELTGAVGEELDKAKLGAATVQEALDNAQKKVEELLSQ